MSHSKKWTELAQQSSLYTYSDYTPHPALKINRLKNNSIALLDEAEQVLKDFQATQLLQQSTAYQRLQELINYINDGD